MTPLEAALSYADEGYFIFPCHYWVPGGFVPDWGDVPGHCSCMEPDCDSMAKHPSCDSPTDATNLKDKIRNWWRRHPYDNIAINLKKSYGVVLDVDPRNGGFESFERIQKDLGINFDGHRMYKTGGDGFHIMFSAFTVSVQSGELPGYPGIDIKGNASTAYVIVPPSSHYSGGFYRWLSRVQAKEIPAPLLAIMKTGSSAEGKQCSVSPNKLSVPIMKLPGLEHLKDYGNYLRGPHPVHGSTTGSNFIVYKADNRWVCMRHRTSGHLLELAAMMAGLCECTDFEYGKENPLTGDMFTQAIAECIDFGFSVEEMNQYFEREGDNGE